ncbi:4059_t:CDS:2 [Ambispora leptoticha]|uniref:4059_t:CDS:1 n=1 Tax=Ambispora leptoticha TaxID=144679 RepID=A0A9N8W5M3_9GLOM|nr:4059_t:CDS:2 [Ambispora leptoticha]
MTRDIIAVPITSVTTEATFSKAEGLLMAIDQNLLWKLLKY